MKNITISTITLRGHLHLHNPDHKMIRYEAVYDNFEQRIDSVDVIDEYGHPLETPDREQYIAEIQTLLAKFSNPVMAIQ